LCSGGSHNQFFVNLKEKQKTMIPARREIESAQMSAIRTSRRTMRTARARKSVRAAAKPVRPVAKPVRKLIAPPEQVMYRLCKPGWAVIVEKIPNAQGTRFVCPFCPVSHRVPGPVRGFRRLRRAQWVKLRRVKE
jgi:hypothetical protein